jgi:plastocyanin
MLSISPFRSLSAGALLSCSTAALLSIGVGCGGDGGKPSGGGASAPSAASSSAPSESVAPSTTEESASPAGESAVAEKAPAKEESKPTASNTATGGTGTLTGVVTLDGSWSALAPLFTKGDESVKDAAVCAHDNIPNETVVVNTEAGNGIANVFVYLAKVPKGVEVPAPPEEPVVMDQKGCVFMPRGLVVQKGQTILVKSDDAVPHNVHTFPTLSAPFNSICPPNERDGLKLVYEGSEREPVSVKCDIHPWMQAWHLPLDHPYAAVTDGEGRFTIENVPAGDLSFRVWHEKTGFVEKSLAVAVKADETYEISISIGAAQLAGLPTPQRAVAQK